MASILGTPANVDNGGTYTPESGNNRAIVWAFSVTTEGDTLTGVTIGGVTANQVYVPGAASAVIAYVLEADLPGGDVTCNASFSTAPEQPVAGVCYTLGEVNQSSPVRSQDTVDNGSTPSVTGSLSVFGGDVGVALVSLYANEAIDASNPVDWVEDRNNSGFQQSLKIAHIEYGADETDSVTFSWTNNRDASAAFVAFSTTNSYSPGLRHTLKDTDDGAVHANLTGLQVMAFKSVPANPTYQATDGTTDGSGVYELNEPTINLNSVTGESLGTTDTNGDLSFTLGAASETLFNEVEAGSISITVGTETITDDGSGNLTGDASATGTIDYSTGSGSITGAPADTAASGDYDWRQTEIFLTLTDSAGENVAAAWMSVVDLNTSNESVIRTGA